MNPSAFASLHRFERETQPVGLPADSALTRACLSWLLLTVNQGVTLMTDVIH